MQKQVIDPHAKTEDLLKEAISDSLKRLSTIARTKVRADLTETSEKHAVVVFEKTSNAYYCSRRLKAESSSAGSAYRTGCKLAVINDTGAYLAKDVIYPHKPVNKNQRARH